MDDEKIVDQLWNGSEQGIHGLNRKYGRLMESIARNILRSEEDAREIVNDALLQIWDAIPPARPADLMAYAAKAFGADGFFFEVHPDPDKALSDGPNMLPLDALEGVIEQLLR